jgi:hypothetical protein
MIVAVGPLPVIHHILVDDLQAIVVNVLLVQEPDDLGLFLMLPFGFPIPFLKNSSYSASEKQMSFKNSSCCRRFKIIYASD